MDAQRKLIVMATIVGLLSLPGCIKQGCDAKTKLVFLQAAPVMSKPYPSWYKGVKNGVVASMRAGQTLPICRFTPAKDFATYTVKLADGRVGYVEYDRARVQEVSNAQASR